MKRLTAIIGILVIVGALAVPVMAWGPHWGGRGGGRHMMGYWGSSPEYGRGDYGNLTSEQIGKLDALDRKFYEDTRELQDQIWKKSRELDIVLNSSEPDLDKAKTLQKEISELQTSLGEKGVNYKFEAHKIAPDQKLGYGYGDWHDRHMGPYGYMMDYGRGPCWN
jgi:zinc resistance-associated protein